MRQRMESEGAFGNATGHGKRLGIGVEAGQGLNCQLGIVLGRGDRHNYRVDSSEGPGQQG